MNPEETKAVVPAGTASTTTVSKPAAKTAGNRKMLYIVAAVAIVGIAAVAAIAAWVIIAKPFGRAANNANFANLNTSNPQLATDSLNNIAKDFMLKVAAKDYVGAQQMFGPLADLKDVAFKASLQAKDATTSLDLSIVGRGLTVDGNKGALDAVINVNGTLPGFGALTGDIDLKVVGDKAYLRLRNLPSELTMQLAFLGLTEDKWYSLPAEQVNNPASLEDTVEDTLSIGELSSMEKEIRENPLFINPKAKDARNVAGVRLDCMEVQINPEFGDAEAEANLKELPPFEMCLGNNGLPMFLGLSATREGTNTVFGIELSAATDKSAIVAPEGAEDLSELLGAFTNSSSTELTTLE